jgi:hypothetical protein
MTDSTSGSSAGRKVVAPNTTRVVEGLRETGYSFQAAVADIVDNSIGVGGANTVAVGVRLAPNHEPVVTVMDDGCGMSIERLEDAMRYGAPRQKNPNSLSKFGLGMKTASTQFCRRLVVVSRAEGSEAVSAAAWDLDTIKEEDDWVLEIDEAAGLIRDEFTGGLSDLAEWSGLPSESGTLVKWEKVDRLLRTKAGKEATNRQQVLDRLVRELVEHLRTVYQRFLDPEDNRARNVRIVVNDVELNAWDPFAEASGVSDLVFDKEFKVTGAGDDEHAVKMRAFILPRKEEVEQEAAFKALQVSLEKQGIYLYREERLIDGPSWFNTGAKETHVNNLRIELSFDAQLDDVFGIGVKKSDVVIDRDFLELLTDTIRPLRNEADNRSRKGKAKTAAAGGNGTQRPTERTISRQIGRLRSPSVEKGSGGSVTVVNKTGHVPVVSEGGKPTGVMAMSPDDEFADMHVVRKDSLEDGVLWQGQLSSHNVLQVGVNSGHDWYQKAYLPIAGDMTLVQAIDFLFYALALAELDATNSERREMFRDLRVDVSRNLRDLVKDLPAPSDD